MNVGDKVPIDSIVVGVRHRKDPGDIAALARSIAEVGLLHPPVVRSDGALIAGGRRVEACKTLGWKHIPVTVVELADIVRGELAENAIRKDFLPSEIDAIRRAIEPIEREAARGRMSEGGKVGKVGKVGKLSIPSDTGKTRDKVGAFAGVSGRSVEKITAVVAAAEAEPSRYGHFLEEMDRTRRIDGVYRRLRVAQQAEQIRAEPPPLPNRGPYRVVVADPAWAYEKRQNDPSHRTTPYPQMSLEQICSLPVASIAHEKCVLWLWTTNAHLLSGDALAVVNAWGFQPKTLLTWAKNKMGNGDWLRGQTEHCILATRGSPTIELTNQTTLLSAPAGAHSAKPEQFYSLVERLCPAPRYATLFHRGPTRPKWDAHGDEIQGASPSKNQDAACEPVQHLRAPSAPQDWAFELFPKHESTACSAWLTEI
jgi:N6-adenosine-specific RNA methylase IME4